MPPRPKAPQTFKGKGRTLDAAIEDAYTRARARKGATRAQPGWYVVDKIEVSLHSPINEYRVALTGPS